jgi:hypothetical protein
MNFTVENLFPTPVFRTNIGRAFTKKELLFVIDKIEMIPIVMRATLQVAILMY